jgi:putative acetyltransferase
LSALPPPPKHPNSRPIPGELRHIYLKTLPTWRKGKPILHNLELIEKEMSNTARVTIEPFRPEDQPAVKALVLAGLVEHWGWLDPYKNPDLEDISSSYAASVFLVARQAGQIIGTGALVTRLGDTGEIVRMSVAASHRRQGIGRSILQNLIDHARKAGLKRIILETTASWSEVIEFYKTAGLELSHSKDGDAYFYQDLEYENTGMTPIPTQEE